MDQDSYKVQTEIFEGPLDLLLHLIKKNKMNILDIRLSEITNEYLDYLENRRGINPSREGDFLMTASTLIYIKSRQLLPKPESLEEDNPEDQLVHTLIEYEKIQKISKLLKEMEKAESLLWKRKEVKEDFGEKEFELQEVTSFQLAEVFMNLVKKKEKEEFMYVQGKEYSIEGKRDEILELLAEPESCLNFNEYVEGLDSMQDIVVSFFVILEMMKRQLVIAVQKRLFDTIYLWKNFETGVAQ